MPANSRVIGRFSEQQVPLDSRLKDFGVGEDDTFDRLGLIPEELQPERMRQIKAGAAQGRIGPLQAVYEKMGATDPRFGGLVTSLLNAVASMDLKVRTSDRAGSGSDEKLAKDLTRMVEYQIRKLSGAKQVMKEFASTIIRGARAFEMKYELEELPYDKRLAMVSDVRPIRGSKLKWQATSTNERYGELMLKTADEPQGVYFDSFHPAKTVVLSSAEGHARWDTLGAARKCLSWYLVKMYAQVWWSEFVEVYGQPIRIGRYPQGASKESQKKMEKFLKVLGKSAYGLFPHNMELQLKEAKSAGQISTFSDIIKMANDEIAIALIGQVQTVGDRKQGSYAKAKVLEGIRQEVLSFAAQIIERGFREGIVSNLVQMNYGPDVPEVLWPRVTPVVERPGEAKAKAERFKLMAEAGTPVPLQHIYEQTGTPEPRDGERVLIGRRIEEYDSDQMPEAPSGSETGTGESGSDSNEGEGSVADAAATLPHEINSELD